MLLQTAQVYTQEPGSRQNFLTKRHPFKEWLKHFIPERLGHRVISMMQPGLVSIPQIAPGTRARLIEDYREDIMRLQNLIQRDLSHWLGPVAKED